VAQIAMMGVAMFAGRPLRDDEHLGGLADVLVGISVPPPIRAWLLKALHHDPRRVFVHAGEASKALNEAIAETGIRPSRRDLDALAGGRSVVTKFKPAASTRPVSPPPQLAAPATATLPRLQPSTAKAPAPIAKPRRDAWQAHDVDPRQLDWQPAAASIQRGPAHGGFRKFLWMAALMLTMTCAFTAAQYVPPPEWLFSKTGTLVIESNPQGVAVLVNGHPHGITPLTLKVEAGVHEVELRGPGKPKMFKVHVTRGDRVAQYIEFFRRQ
jgi:hypothetical protein